MLLDLLNGLSSRGIFLIGLCDGRIDSLREIGSNLVISGLLQQYLMQFVIIQVLNAIILRQI